MDKNLSDLHSFGPEGQIGPINSLKMPRFAGFTTFARLPRIDQVASYDVAVVGVPFDSGVSYRPGARFGPNAIREASRLLRPYDPANETSPFYTQQVVDAGDIGCNPFNIHEALKTIEDEITTLNSGGKKVLTLGGDHTIALPILRSLNAQYGPVSVLHFDSHLDTWDTYFGEPCTHGTPFRRASEENLILKGSSLHVGTRGSIYDKSDLDDDARLGFGIISARDIPDLGVKEVVRMIKARVGDTALYVSIDIDVLDPAFAPGTGTPEAGGLSSRELLAILRGINNLNIIGADIVEVAPVYDHAEITSIAASHLAYEFISGWSKRIQKDPRPQTR